jgi:CheY-like chemotaxis protein
MDRQLHILIIDDDADDVGFLADAFIRALPQTRITVCQNGQEAIDFLANNLPVDCPDLVFLDLYMPGKSGYEVLLEVKVLPDCEEYPIMAISTSVPSAEAERYREAGCAFYFDKPASLEAYDEIVAASLHYLSNKTL